MRFQVRLEPFAVSGPSSENPPLFLGTFEAPTFVDACRIAIRARHWDEADFTEGPPPGHWGCRFFDNEADARQGLGRGDDRGLPISRID